MISFYSLLLILVVHTIFDFKLQTGWQATNKSKSFIALTNHVAIYTIGLTLIPVLSVYLELGNFTLMNYFLFVVSNSIIHWITDAITSRASANAIKKENIMNFWTTIGIDQLIHSVTLIGTYILLAH